MKWPKLWFVNNIINSNQESHSLVFMSGIFVLHAHKIIRTVHSKKWQLLKLHSLNVTDTLRDDMHKFMLNESIKCQIKILSHFNSISFVFIFRISVCFSLHLFAWLRILAKIFVWNSKNKTIIAIEYSVEILIVRPSWLSEKKQREWKKFAESSMPNKRKLFRLSQFN